MSIGNVVPPSGLDESSALAGAYGLGFHEPFQDIAFWCTKSIAYALTAQIVQWTPIPPNRRSGTPPQFHWEPNTLMNALNTERAFPTALQTSEIPEHLLAPPQPQPSPAFCPDWHIFQDIQLFGTAASEDHSSDRDTSVCPDVVEDHQTPQGSSGNGPKSPEKRRKLNAQKSRYISELREAMGLSHKDSSLKVLNEAIARLGGTVPQSNTRESAKRIRLAFKELHRVLGEQGRLKHVRCLERAIKMVKGEDTLEIIHEGRPSGSA
ncbi:hypothetical protein BJ322DRAFT_1041548, partial [Thelephora terrestris]